MAKGKPFAPEFKQEAFRLRRDQARLEVFDFIEGFYNPRRRQSALGYVFPDRFEEKEGMIKEKELTAVVV